MTLSDEQIQELLRVGNPTDEECRLIRMGWDAALAQVRTQGIPDGWKLMPVEPTQEMIDHVIDERLDALAAGKDHTFIDIYKAMLAVAPEAKP